MGIHRYPLLGHSGIALAALSLGAALLLGAPARAQQAAESAAASELGEITVTARKQSELLLNVPVVATILPKAQLENLQTTEITDLPALVPGMLIGHSVLATGGQISIRGIGEFTLDSGVDQTVTLNIDGLPLGQGLALYSGLFDLDRIEVLKGPQPLFYGKSAVGGVLALRTADPTDQPEMIASAAYEFYSIAAREELILSGPVSDTLKLRLSTMYQRQEGYFENVAMALPGTGALDPAYDRGPNGDSYIVRGTVLWNPTSQFEARLKANFTQQNADYNDNFELTSCPAGTKDPFGIPFIGGGETCSGPQRNFRLVDMDPANFPGVPNGGTPFFNQDQKYGTLELNYRPSDTLTLSSTTGYYDLLTNTASNATNTTYAGPAIEAGNKFNRHDLTEEVRLTTNFTTPLNYVVGGFYEDADFGDQITVLGNTAYGLPGLLFAHYPEIHGHTYSAFGQVRWQIVPKVELDVGVRWADETRTETDEGLGGSLGTAPIPVLVPEVHSNKAMPDVTLTYKPVEDMTVWGAFRIAYQSGSFATSELPGPTGLNNAFGDEEGKGGELGVKSWLLDRTLSLNVSGYYYRYNGLQVGAVLPVVTGLVETATVNAGSAETYGIDLDAAYHPPQINGLTLKGSLEFDIAKFITFTNAPCYGGQTIAMGCNQLYNPTSGLYQAQDLSGTPLIRAPKWQFNLGADYELPVMGDYKLTMSGNVYYSDKYVTWLAVDRPNEDNYQSRYAKLDLGLSLRSPNGVWELSAIAKNVTDKLTTGVCSNSNYQAGALFGGQIQGGTTSGPAGIDGVGCFFDPGTELWLRLTVRPFGTRN